MSNGFEETMGGMMASLFGGRESVKWNMARKTIKYEGGDYVIMGYSVGSNIMGTAGGVFVIERRAYAKRSACNLRFIPGEFLVDAYPSRDPEHMFDVIEIGNASDSEADDAAVKCGVEGAKRSSENAMMPAMIETFANNGRFEYPELSEEARMFLRIPLLRATYSARLKALLEGEPDEEVERLTKEAMEEAQKGMEEWAIARSPKPKAGEEG